MGVVFRTGRFLLALAAASSAVLLFGCIGQTGPLPPMASYDLEYSPTAFPGLPRLGVEIGISFAASKMIGGGTDMVYATTSYRRYSYTYARWVSPPSELFAAFLARDAARSGLFSAVFHGNAGLMTRFVLDGTVDEFLEVDDLKMGKARAEITVTLSDMRPASKPPVILFQKTYEAEGPASPQTPDALAAGMSLAVQSISRRVIRDAYDALSSHAGSE